MKLKIFSNDKFFIAGAKGMVGSAVCKALQEKGYGDINQGGNLLTPNKKELNLLDKNSVEKWFIKNKPSITILAAAKVGGIGTNQNHPVDFLLENIKIQNNVIESAWKNGVRRFLFLGSSCIYPKFARQPIKEEDLLNGSLEPTNEYYALAKITGIKLCQSLRKQYGFDAISLMPSNLYGKNDNYDKNSSHVLPALIRKFSEAIENNNDSVTCWGTGKPLREFLHVDDLAQACIFALERWDPPKEDTISHINVGSQNELTIKDLADKISKKLNYQGKILWDTSKPDGTPRKKLDTKKMNQLGWRAKINLDKGIEDAINDFRNNKSNLRI